MSVVNVHAAKTQLSREEVIIARAGKPVVKLVPIAEDKPRRRLGTLAGKLTIPDDFDAPLPDEIIAEFEGR